MVITYDDFFATFKEVDHLYSIKPKGKRFFSLENNRIMERCYDEQGKIGCLVNELFGLNIFSHEFAFFTLLSFRIRNLSFCAGPT